MAGQLQMRALLFSLDRMGSPQGQARVEEGVPWIQADFQRE